ncbi:AraC family transcriptional regulator [Sporofaciens sp. JLR.KK001]
MGFSDYNYFYRVFKKETGISAKKYRYENTYRNCK